MSVVLRDLAFPLAHFVLDVSLQLDARTTALYGPSGAGKTSVLELIAGLRAPLRGLIELNGRDVLLSEMLCEVAHQQGYPEAKGWWLGPVGSGTRKG